MAEMTPIEFDGVKYALYFQNRQLEEGVHFLTPDDLPLQVGVLVHQAGKTIRAHVHRDCDKLVHSTYEVLYVIDGRLEVTFYSPGGVPQGAQELAAGDTIILMSGGHGFKVIERCRVIEVKQGPYLGIDLEKAFFGNHRP